MAALVEMAAYRQYAADQMSVGRWAGCARGTNALILSALKSRSA
jgi:hypothetical protein